jgi:Flp pilus assembly pilin Flp
MNLEKMRRRARAALTRLWAEDAGAVTVEYAVIIGVVLLLAAVLLGPHLMQLVQSLISKWQVQ